MNAFNKFRALLADRPSGGNLRLVVTMTPTQTVDDWLKMQPQMKTYYDCRRVRIDEIDARHIAINILFDDPLTAGLSLAEFRSQLNAEFGWRSVPVGVDEDGEVKRLDWVTTPHMLVGGTTNAGKSKMVGAQLAALRESAEGVNLVLLDPKKVEFSEWKPVSTVHATEQEDIVAALGSMVELMEARFEYMRVNGVKTVWDDPYAMTVLGGPVLVAVDELADLLDGSGKDAGTPIGRIAQKGRAAGIHLLLATQNPRADLFSKTNGTATLKSNLGNRLALRTGTTSESNIILGDGTSGPASGADASTIARSLAGTAIDHVGVRFRCPYLDDAFVFATAVDRPVHSLDDLFGMAQVKPALDFGGESAGEIDTTKSAGTDDSEW